jgi:Curli production assembly/transport component CsgG
MKKNKFHITLIILILSIYPCMAVEKNVIAIFDFYGVMGNKSSKGVTLSLLLFAELSNYDSIKMVERLRLKKIMGERKLNRSSLVNRKYIELAAIVNADYIVTGRIYRDDDEGEITVNLKLTKCSDGKIFGKSFSTPITKKNEYLDKIVKKAAKFIKKSL